MAYTIQIKAIGTHRFTSVWKCFNIPSMRSQYILWWKEGKEKGFIVRVLDNDNVPLSPVCLGNIRRMFGLEKGRDFV